MSMSFCGIWSFLRVPNPEAVPAVFDVTDQVQAGGHGPMNPIYWTAPKTESFTLASRFWHNNYWFYYKFFDN